MPNYDLVANSINNLANRIERSSARKNQDELAAANIGLQKAQIGLQSGQIEGEQQLKLADAQRNNFLNEDVTGRQAILTHPKWDDNQKKSFISSIEKKLGPETASSLLDGMAFKRGAWASAFQKAISDYQTTQATSKYRSEMIGLARERASGGKTSTADKKYTDNINLQNLMGKYNIAEGIDGGLKSPNLTAEQAQSLQREAAGMGLNVYLDQGKMTDTGSGWNPFDNKEVDVYTVRAIAPSGGNSFQDTGLSRQSPPSQQSEAAKVISQYLKTPARQNPMVQQSQPAQQESGPQIVQRGQRFYVQTGQGEREATPEEIDQWRSGSTNFIDSLMTGTRPQRRRGGTPSVGQVPAGRGY